MIGTVTTMSLAMRRAAIPLTAALALAACTTPPPGPAAAAGTQSAAQLDPGCQVRGHSGMTRPGDNIPINMRVQNADKWCFSGFGFSGLSALGSRVVDNPAHGEVRLLVRTGGVMFGYRPKPAYVGPDSFLISMPSGIGYDFNLAVTVRVVPRA